LIIKKIFEGPHNVLNFLETGKIHMIINTPSRDKTTYPDEKRIRSTSVKLNIPIVTTIAAAAALASGLERYIQGDLDVRSIQSWYGVKRK
jgi:carbamoyl-phosphate synthase large subunit